MQFDSPNNSDNYGGVRFIEVASSFSNYGGKIFYNGNSNSKHLYLTTQNLGTIGGGIAIYRTQGRVQIFGNRAAVRTAVPAHMFTVTGFGTTTGYSTVVEDFNGNINFRVRDDGRISMNRIPTSSVGLAAGDVWRNGTNLVIV
jgi:hypothetical protein